MAGASAADHPKLMLISFDGFGWKYLSKFPKNAVPHFEKFMNAGVQVKWIENVFPTVTRTNHMSMVSGLYAEGHGIVHNEFYDPSLNECFPDAGKLTPEDSKWVDVGAEPIWVTNSKAGDGRRSGCILWPCADAKIKGMLPDELIRGEHTVSQRKFNEQQRIDKALEWLTDPKEAVNFVAVYFPEPDEVGHKCGPDSQEVQQAILDLDKALGYLMDQVEKNGLSGKLNIIVTADHGQLRTYPHPTAEINIDRLVDRDWYRIEPNLRNGVAMANIWPKEGFQDKLLERLRHHNLHVCVKNSSQDLRDLHYSSSCRIGPVVVYAEEGWLIVDDSSDRRSVGEHGWDPRYSINMYPFFIATGPAFKKGVRDAAPFRMVDIYPMMCHILGLEPAPNNGTLENVRHILATE